MSPPARDVIGERARHDKHLSRGPAFGAANALQHLRFARQGLADEIANEAPDDDILSQLRNLGIE